MAMSTPIIDNHSILGAHIVMFTKKIFLHTFFEKLLTKEYFTSQKTQAIALTDAAVLANPIQAAVPGVDIANATRRQRPKAAMRPPSSAAPGVPGVGATTTSN